MSGRRAVALALTAGTVAGCGQRAPEPVARIAHHHLPSLSKQTRAGAAVGAMRCRPGEGTRAWAHIELFARGRVVLLPAGIGIAPPRRTDGAYVHGGRCRYPIWTDEPTGLVALRQDDLTLGDLLRIWGRPATARGAAGYRGEVRVSVGGRRVSGPAHAVRLTPHAQVVVQIGAPWVRPNAVYAFPPGR